MDEVTMKKEIIQNQIKESKKHPDEGKPRICARIIRENMSNVMNDKPLTLPLYQLKCDCNFMAFYNGLCDLKYGTKKEIALIKRRIYQQRPDVKKRIAAYQRVYKQKPRNLKKTRKYYLKYRGRPGVKEKMKEYRKKYESKPEVKARRSQRQRERYALAKMDECNKCGFEFSDGRDIEEFEHICIKGGGKHYAN